MAGLKFTRAGALERYLYEADWQRRRAEFMQTAAMVKACLGNGDGAQSDLVAYFGQLFPEYGESLDRSEKKSASVLKKLEDLPAIPIQPPPPLSSGLERLQRTTKMEELRSSWDPPKPKKKGWEGV